MEKEEQAASRAGRMFFAAEKRQSGLPRQVSAGVKHMTPKDGNRLGVILAMVILRSPAYDPVLYEGLSAGLRESISIGSLSGQYSFKP